ncbi:MAG: multidrug ABC transporter ATP-binding protein, partial [Planctomycetota bacterium]
RARIEMRELLKELHLMGKTILISSHILLEMADLCNVVGIIEQGELKFTGTMSEIIQRARTMGGGGTVLTVGVASKAAQAAAFLQSVPGIDKVEAFNGDRLGQLKISLADDAASSAEAAPRIASALIEKGYALTRLEEEQVNLETAFMRLTKGLVQ